MKAVSITPATPGNARLRGIALASVIIALMLSLLLEAPTTGKDETWSNWRVIHMTWVYSFILLLLALPGTLVGVLTLLEQYNKWRSNHAKKES